jgi:hypothetical protein
MNNTQVGDKVLVFDHRLFKDDKSTPLSMTMKEAKVICRYGQRSRYNPSWIYPDLIDVVFDYRPNEISHAHFTEYIKRID